MSRSLVAAAAAAMMLTLPAMAQNRAVSGQAPALSDLDSQFLTHAGEDN
jgi:hypothetical protein